MLRQNELAFIKAISTFQMLPALLKELRLTKARRKKKAAVPAGKRSTTSGSGTKAYNSSRASAKPTSWHAQAT